MSSSYESFDDFLATDQFQDNVEVKPFPFREDKSEEGTLNHLVLNFDSKESAAQSRMITYRRYMSLYKGIHWRYFDMRDNRRDFEYSPRKPRMVMNFCYEMTEQKVSQMARLKTNFTAIPHTGSNEDIQATEAVNLLLKAKADEVDIEKCQIEADRIKYIYGMSFNWVRWNPILGELLPAYKKMMDEKGEVKIKGKKVKDEVRQGDIEIIPLSPDKVFPELGRKDWREVREIDIVEWIHIDELKADYPSKADKIMENKRQKFDYEYLDYSRPEEYIMVRHFYYPPNKYEPKGVYIKYTDDVILEQTAYPFNHGKLPIVMDKDIEVYNELWGRSFYTNIENLQRFYNNILSSQARDYGVASTPKWMMPKGSCSIHDLNNELTIVEYTGPVPPQLITHSPTPQQGYKMQEDLEKKIAQLSRVYDISRGEVPAGVTANSALRFLDEQETQNIVTQEMSRKRKVLDTYKMMLDIMRQYYKPSDGRMIKYLGSDNSYLIKSFDTASFERVYDIRLQNTSALPDTKTGKISAIIDLNTATQTDPVFKREEVIQMLDLGLDETFTTQATASLNAAKEILAMMLRGEEVPEPKEWEDLIVHHTTLYREMQKPSFQLQVSEPIRLSIEARMKVLEGLMWLRSTKNQKFNMKLMDIEYYPLFFTPPAPPAPMMPPMGPEGAPQPAEQPMRTGEMELTKKMLQKETEQ